MSIFFQNGGRNIADFLTIMIFEIGITGATCTLFLPDSVRIVFQDSMMTAEHYVSDFCDGGSARGLYRTVHPCQPCVKYVTCYEGNPFEQSCPVPTVFDPERSECNWKRDVPSCE